MSDGLLDNHTIVGMHLQDGNPAKVDVMGFVHEVDNRHRDIVVESGGFYRMQEATRPVEGKGEKGRVQ